jgi:predicted permease
MVAGYFIFAIMVAGYFIGRFKLLPAGASEVLSRFVFVIALPALILASLSSITIAEFFNWHYIGALGGGMLAMFCIGMLVARYLFPGSLTAISLHGLTAMYSSTGYIGLPLVLTVFGDAGRAPGIIGAIITGLVFAPLAIILAEIDRNQGSRFRVWPPLLTAFTRPPVIAVVAGLSVSAAGIDVPLPVTTFFELLGGAFVPCALFAAGLFIAGCSVRGATAEIRLPGGSLTVYLNWKAFYPSLPWSRRHYRAGFRYSCWHSSTEPSSPAVAPRSFYRQPYPW